jgi:hypothetical protein
VYGLARTVKQHEKSFIEGEAAGLLHVHTDLTTGRPCLNMGTCMRVRALFGYRILRDWILGRREVLGFVYYLG